MSRALRHYPLVDDGNPHLSWKSRRVSSVRRMLAAVLARCGETWLLLSELLSFAAARLDSPFQEDEGFKPRAEERLEVGLIASMAPRRTCSCMQPALVAEMAVEFFTVGQQARQAHSHL